MPLYLHKEFIAIALMLYYRCCVLARARYVLT